jgi:hypothetical protein
MAWSRLTSKKGGAVTKCRGQGMPPYITHNSQLFTLTAGKAVRGIWAGATVRRPQ